MHVFGAEFDIRAFERFADGGNVDGGYAYHDVASRFPDERRNRLDERDALGGGVVHFPVACNNGFSHNIFISLNTEKGRTDPPAPAL